MGFEEELPLRQAKPPERRIKRFTSSILCPVTSLSTLSSSFSPFIPIYSFIPILPFHLHLLFHPNSPLSSPFILSSLFSPFIFIYSFIPIFSFISIYSFIPILSFTPINSFFPILSFNPIYSFFPILSFNPYLLFLPHSLLPPIYSFFPILSFNPYLLFLPHSLLPPIYSFFPILSFTPIYSLYLPLPPHLLFYSHFPLNLYFTSFNFTASTLLIQECIMYLHLHHNFWHFCSMDLVINYELGC